MPHACVMRTPWRSSNAFISASGTAEPPQITIRRLDRSGLCSSAQRSRSSQIVGTAPASVTRSPSISFAIGSACRKRLGMTRLAPAMHAP